MTNRRLLIGGGVFTLILLLLVGSCSVISSPSGGTPAPTATCRAAVFSPESAPPGSHFFGDGSSFLTLDARSMSAQFAASAACDPFQISVREMIWGLEPLPNETARFARQQQLAGDMNLLTAATKRVNRIIKESAFSVDTNWSGPYETLAAAHTAEGWHAYKLTTSMAGQAILVQKTKGGRVFLWKVKCLWQPVARVLQGFPAAPPAHQTPPPPPPSGGGGGHTTTTTGGGNTTTTQPHGSCPAGYNCKDPADGIGNNPGAAGQGDTGHRAGGPEPSSPPVNDPPPASIVDHSTTTLPPPDPGPSQPPVTDTVPSPVTAPG